MTAARTGIEHFPCGNELYDPLNQATWERTTSCCLPTFVEVDSASCHAPQGTAVVEAEALAPRRVLSLADARQDYRPIIDFEAFIQGPASAPALLGACNKSDYDATPPSNWQWPHPPQASHSHLARFRAQHMPLIYTTSFQPIHCVLDAM